MSETPRSIPNASSLWKALRSMQRSVEARPAAAAVIVGHLVGRDVGDDVAHGRGAPQAVEQRLGLRGRTEVVVGQRPPRGRDRLPPAPGAPRGGRGTVART